MAQRRARGITAGVCATALVLLHAGCVSSSTPGSSASSATPTRAPAGSNAPAPSTGGSAPDKPPVGRAYPVHTRIVATTFWIGELFDPTASDGSQVVSTYDSRWLQRYGGCDGTVSSGICETERRTAANGFFPTRMTPRQNPFYLDLPFDDLNDAKAVARRGSVVPWAGDRGFAGRAKDRGFSYMKNRWVAISRAGRTCYGQIEDAGPGQYDDYLYVFGHVDRRPANRRFNGAGMDVSPALNGCLGFSELNGQNDVVDWRFVDDVGVPPGPWKKRVTKDGVLQ